MFFQILQFFLLILICIFFCRHAGASSQLADARYLNSISGFYDFNATNPTVNDVTSYEKLELASFFF